MTSIENITNIINDSNWAARTKRNRISFIIKLKKQLEPNNNNLTFLKDFKLVSNYILNTTKNPSTIKSKILTIKAILNLFDTKSASKYDKLVYTVIHNDDLYKGDNIQNPKKFISYKELIAIPDIIKNHIECVYNKLFLDHNDIDSLNNNKAIYIYLRFLTDYIISVLYCYQPPVRADWATVILNSSKKENWYDYHKGIIHWLDFKNIKSFGPKSFILDSNIKDILSHYLYILNYIIPQPKFLLYLVNQKGFKPFSRETFSVYFIRMMKKYINKNISINDIRHSYENHIIKDPNYNKLTINQKKDIHDRLLHSVSTAQQYLTV